MNDLERYTHAAAQRFADDIDHTIIMRYMGMKTTQEHAALLDHASLERAELINDLLEDYKDLEKKVQDQRRQLNDQTHELDGKWLTVPAIRQRFAELRERNSYLELANTNRKIQVSIGEVEKFYGRDDILELLHAIEFLEAKPTPAAYRDIEDALEETRANLTTTRRRLTHTVERAAALERDREALARVIELKTQAQQ